MIIVIICELGAIELQRTLVTIKIERRLGFWKRIIYFVWPHVWVDNNETASDFRKLMMTSPNDMFSMFFSYTCQDVGYFYVRLLVLCGIFYMGRLIRGDHF